MSYRDRRSPDRARERYAAAAPIDSYIPPTSSRASRPRSRSPVTYRGRSRTPPRPAANSWRPVSPGRRFDARADSYSSRDIRPRSPRKDYAPTNSRYEDISRLTRERSPAPLKRERDPSLYGRGARSPPPAKRERIVSPARDYGRPRSPPRRPYSPPRDGRMNYAPQSRSPRREERVDPYAAKSWRRPSPSPRVHSGRDSVTTSRRSSPHPYSQVPKEIVGAEDAQNTSASSYRSPSRRDPPPAARVRSPYHNEVEQYSSRAKPPSERGYMAVDQSYPSRDTAQPLAADYRERAPPTAPAGSYRETPPSAISPPTGPSSAAPSISAHNRSGPPSGPAFPRGGYGNYRGRGGPPAPRDYLPPRRGPSSWGAGAIYGRGGAARDPYPPRDPAASYDGRAALPRRDSSYGAGVGGPNLRGSSNSTSTTYPRSQRFNQALFGIPEVKPGGEKMPSRHDTSKADKLEEEAARLRKMIDDKEIKKRQGLREWERLEKESSNASLRSELAEDHLRSLNGEAQGMTAAF